MRCFDDERCFRGNLEHGFRKDAVEGWSENLSGWFSCDFDGRNGARLLGASNRADAQGQEQQPPNILVIMADDIGYWNISAYNRGMMGYRTPNIDRIANEGAIFTDYYGQQSCTAGRAAFITGQSPMRTGLLKVGLPGAKEGTRTKIRRLLTC